MAQKKQNQNSSENSTAIQAGRDIHYGLSASEVQEMLRQHEEKLNTKYALADTKATSQLGKLYDLLTPLLLSDPSFVEAYSQPDFIANTREAQESAIRSDDVNDLELLSSMLIQRAKVSDPTPRHKMATRRAIKVVGQLSQKDLDTLTVLWLGLNMTPAANRLDAILTHTEGYFAPFVESGLQASKTWISDLQITDCITVGSAGIGHLKGFSELFGQNKYPGFFCIGMSVEECATAKNMLKKVKPGFENLIETHHFEDNRFKLFGTNEHNFREIISKNKPKLTKLQHEKIEEVVKLNNYSTMMKDYNKQVEDVLSKYPSLNATSAWWRSGVLPVIDITPVGMVLAHSNFKRLLPKVNAPSLADLIGS